MKVLEKYENSLKEDLRDPAEAAEYLNAALEDGSQEVFLMALKDVANAKGISEIARETKLNRENLYRILSIQGNPKLKSLSSVLHSVGLKLSIEVESRSKMALNAE
ncbi:MAG: addiction module antidote protein [Desulfotignum sp.]|nr:putative addiction module antidote protein [Desulfobacteraceae bacterium]MDZ7666193.1 addiction module antidote protein [Desulfotignum sp.]